jgi:hypothetical protein
MLSLYSLCADKLQMMPVPWFSKVIRSEAHDTIFGTSYLQAKSEMFSHLERHALPGPSLKRVNIKERRLNSLYLEKLLNYTS